MKFSVLICTYNRHLMLENCLTTLIDKTSEKPDEIVVVNGGDEEAEKVVNSFRGRNGIDIKLIKTRNINLAVSRNIGLPVCSGDIIALTDDDAEVACDWVTQMKRVHSQHPEAGAVGGAVIGTGADSLASRLADLVVFAFYPFPREVRFVAGVNASYKKEAVRAVGKQDESLFRGEDVDFNWRIFKAGYKLFYDPLIKVYHHHPESVLILLRHQYMYGKAYYLVRRKWSDIYCVYPRGIRTFKDALKLFYFFGGIFYESFLYLKRIKKIRDRVFMYPLLVLCAIIWRTGMVNQFSITFLKKVKNEL